MFTGIITGIGYILSCNPLGETAAFGRRLMVQTPPDYLIDTKRGDSIAINGACMTVIELSLEESCFVVEISAQSLHLTCGLDAVGAVNLELALRPQDRLGGHLVTGHVDGKGLLAKRQVVGESHVFDVWIPQALSSFVARKGSITLNGVSLTINEVSDNVPLKNGTIGTLIQLNMIPHTLTNTTFSQLTAGQWMNVEVDLLARYIQRQPHPSLQNE